MSQGDVPVVEVLKLLSLGGYEGWIAFEWEKHWHPEIEEPEVALPDFVRALRAAEAKLEERIWSPMQARYSIALPTWFSQDPMKREAIPG